MNRQAIQWRLYFWRRDVFTPYARRTWQPVAIGLAISAALLMIGGCDIPGSLNEPKPSFPVPSTIARIIAAAPGDKCIAPPKGVRAIDPKTGKDLVCVKGHWTVKQ